MRGSWLALPLIAGLLLADSHVRAAGPDALLFRVRSVELVGLGPGTLPAVEILALEVELSPSWGGYVAPRSDRERALLRLAALGGSTGTGTRLSGSALQAIVDAIASAHRARGLAVRADVSFGALGRLREPDGDGRLLIELSAEEPARVPQAGPHAPARFGRDAVLVTVRSISFAGLSGLPVRENEILAQNVNLSWDPTLIPPGYVAPRRHLAIQAVPLWNIGGWDRGGAQLYGSALEEILDEVRSYLARNAASARVSLNRRAVRRLATPGSDGLLLLDVEGD